MIIDCAHYRDGLRQDEGPVPLEEAAARAHRAGSSGSGCSNRARPSWPRSRSASGCTNWRSRTLRPTTCGRRSRTTTAACGSSSCAPRATTTQREEVEFGEISVFVGADVRDHDPPGHRQRVDRRPRPSGTAARSCSRRAPIRRCGRCWTRWSMRTPRSSPASNETSTRSRRRCSPAPWHPPNGSTRCAARPPTSTAPCTRCSASSTIERAAAPELLPYLRDVHDHLLLVNEEVAAQRDLLGTVLEANMAVISVEQTKVSVRQNATMEQLTVLATVFLPLTFVTGFFGQNFGWLVGTSRAPPRSCLRHRRADPAAGAAVRVAEAPPAGPRYRRGGRDRPAAAALARMSSRRAGAGPGHPGQAGHPADWGHGRGAMDSGKAGVGAGRSGGAAARPGRLVQRIPAAKACRPDGTGGCPRPS